MTVASEEEIIRILHEILSELRTIRLELETVKSILITK